NKTILSIAEAENGDKYVSTYKGGISVIKNNTIRKLEISEGHMPAYVAYAVAYKQYIWAIGLSGGRKLYRIRNGRMKEVQFPGSDKNVIPYRAFRYGEDIFFATNNGVYKVHNDTLVSPYLPQLFAGRSIDDIKPGHNGAYWVAAESTVYKVSGDRIVELYWYAGSAV